VAALSLAAATSPIPAAGQESDASGGGQQEEIIERILELREQIEALLEALPRELRDEVERRWRERSPTEETPAEVDPADGAGEPTVADGPPPSQAPADPIAVAQPEEVPPQTAAAIPETTEPEETAAQPEAPSETVIADEERIVTPKQGEVSPPCGGFHLFDTNEDAVISGGDRQWRFLRLWFDGNGDGRIDEAEIETLFDLGIRQIDVELKSYQNAEGSSEDVDVEDFVWLRRAGKGRAERRSGALAVDASRLVRDGRLWLITADGTQLEGFQALGSAALLETRDGERLPVVCGDSP
jgi:hypothetical protein